MSKPLNLESKGFELMETHISWVLLKDNHAYKIKKPVKFSFLDFSTPEKRKYYAEKEVELNRRLCPDMYEGIVEVKKNKDNISFGGGESTGEYAVKMKRFPQEKIMTNLLKENKVKEEEIRELAGIIIKFHSSVEDSEKYNSAELIKEQYDDIGTFSKIIEEATEKNVKHLLEMADGFIEKNQGLIDKRRERGKVKNCHGDLHSGNIFIDDGIKIFDCIEFNEEFRYVDIVSEIAFLSMDLEYQGKGEFAMILENEYMEKSMDDEFSLLIDFYKSYRANVRAKVAAISYSQNPSEEEREKIKRYLELAEKYIKRVA